MKSFVALSLVAGMSALFAGPLAAAETKGSQGAMAKANQWGEAPTPHFKPSGKPVSAARGAQVYEDHCALCHGLGGKGDGPRSAFFQAGQQYIADLSNADFVKGRDDQLLHSIREGLQRFPEPSYVMPQFKYILSEEEIHSALAYIKTLPAKAKKR
ncbi:MAG: cytochrome c [Deltaproteobacteria bacterium]|nr:cytochrome c [Deltaproteobacteria bacterium]